MTVVELESHLALLLNKNNNILYVNVIYILYLKCDILESVYINIWFRRQCGYMGWTKIIVSMIIRRIMKLDFLGGNYII